MSLTIVRPQNIVTIPKKVRDNMGLMPHDWIEFDTDDRSWFISRLIRETPDGIRRINEAAPEYDSRAVTSISASAEIVIPDTILEALMLETRSVLGFFREEVGYRAVPIYNPTRYGASTFSYNGGGFEIVENAIMEYSVATIHEMRAEKSLGLGNLVRDEQQEPFLNVLEPEDDRVILDRLTKNDPAFQG